MAEYTVILSKEADDGLRQGIYEFTAGGIRNVETKKMVQLFRPTGEIVNLGNRSSDDEACVRMALPSDTQEDEKYKHELNTILSELKRSEKLGWEAVAVGYLNYHLSVNGFAHVSDQLISMWGATDRRYTQEKVNQYNQYSQDLMNLFVELNSEKTDITSWEAKRTLTEISAFLEGLRADFESGNHDTSFSAEDIVQFTMLFSQCVEELKIYCLLLNYPVPPAYEKWTALVEMITGSETIMQELRKMTYLSCPLLKTKDAEIASKISLRTIKCLRVNAQNTQRFIASSGMSRGEYLDFYRDVEKQWQSGNYQIGNLIDERQMLLETPESTHSINPV